MVRERNRNIDRTKAQEPDIDSLGTQQTNRTPNYTSNYRSYMGGSRSGSAMTDVASGLALVLSVIAFFFSSYAVIQAVSARRQSESVRPPTSAVPNSFSGTGGGSSPANTDATRRVALPSLGTTPPRVEPGRYVQPTYGGSGRVEILSAQRVGGSPASNLVNVRLRFERAESPTGGEIPINGGGDIKLDDAIAINTRTNQTFPVVRYQNPGDEPISLYRLRPGEATEATITLRVPERLNRIDLRIPATNVFRNVPIAAPA